MKEIINKLFREYVSTNGRMPFVAWILFPIAFVWFSVNYVAEFYDSSTSWERLERLTKDPGIEVRAESVNWEVPELKWTGGGLITLWFDDAWYSQYRPTLNMLENYGFKAALSVPTELVGYDAYMTWPHVKKLQHLGWEISAHSRSHSCSDNTTMEDAENQVSGSQWDLHSHNIDATFYVYTCGIVTEELNKVVKEKFLAARTVEWGLNPVPVKDPYNLKVIEINPDTSISQLSNLIREANTTNQWIILMFHQIDNEGQDYSSSPEQLERILKVIDESGVPVVLPTQVINIIPA